MTFSTGSSPSGTSKVKFAPDAMAVSEHWLPKVSAACGSGVPLAGEQEPPVLRIPPRHPAYVVEDAARRGTALVVETGRLAVMEPDPVPTEPILPREVAAGIRTARSSGCQQRHRGFAGRASRRITCHPLRGLLCASM